MSTTDPIATAAAWLETDRISRRQALRQIGLLAGAAAVAGCTPLRIALHSYPDCFDDDRVRTDRVLAAFVRTVIPGADGADAELARPFHDTGFPFERYAAFFASDLCRRARRLDAHVSFELLDEAGRRTVVHQGLHSDATAARLYRGAVFLAQISVYAGIYDDERGCPLIDFPGSNGGYLPEEYSYANPGSFLPAGLTANGNYS